MTPRRTGLIAIGIVALAASGAEAAVPSGVYGCTGYMGSTLMPMGTIEIKGSTFRYAAPGDKPGAFKPYTVDGAGKISWNGPMGALNEAPSRIKDSYVETKPGYRSIIVKHQPTGNGFTMTMGCRSDVKPGH